MATKKKTSAKTKTKKRKAAPRPEGESSYQEALKDYTSAIELVRAGDHAQARERLEKLVSSYPAETGLVDRARVYIDYCEQQLSDPPEPPKTAEDYYTLGVIKANEGILMEAHDMLTLALQGAPDSPKILYARATVKAMNGKVEEAVSDLRRAIDIEPTLRYQATNDSDFESIRDEAAFIDLIEPTPTGA